MLVTDGLRGHPVAIRFNFPFNQRLIQPSSVEIDQCSELDVPRSDQQQYQWQQQIGPVDGRVNANQLLQGKHGESNSISIAYNISNSIKCEYSLNNIDDNVSTKNIPYRLQMQVAVSLWSI